MAFPKKPYKINVDRVNTAGHCHFIIIATLLNERYSRFKHPCKYFTKYGQTISIVENSVTMWKTAKNCLCYLFIVFLLLIIPRWIPWNGKKAL